MRLPFWDRNLFAGVEGVRGNLDALDGDEI